VARIDSSVIPNMQGKCGGLVLYRTKNGEVARQYVRPLKSKAPSLKTCQGNFRQCVNLWRSLSPAQKKWYMVEAYNSRLNLNGFQYFIHLFINTF
jgi:hypothetical protein